MQSMLNFLIVLHLFPLCHSAPGLFDNDGLFASNMFSQPDVNLDNLQPYASLDGNYDFDTQSFDGLNLGAGADPSSESSMFQPFDESSQDHQDIDPYQDIIADAQNECSSTGLSPASRLRPRLDWCDQKPDTAVEDLKLPTLDSLPSKRPLPKPSPINPPSWQRGDNPEICPMSFKGQYYLVVCGTRSNEPEMYIPTALNFLHGWTVIDASICESNSFWIQIRISGI